MAAVLPHPLSEYTLDRFGGLVASRLVDEQLVPMLISGHRPDPFAICQEAWSRVEPLVTLSTRERQYFEEVAAGRLRLELLFGDDRAAVDRLAEHPALSWKISNVRQPLERRAARR